MRKFVAFGLFWIVLVANGLQPAYAQGSGAEHWKSCQSDDADRRLAGCSAVIEAKGFGSQARLSDALDGRCWAYHVKGKYDLAVADCKASIALRPNYSYAYNNLGTAYLGLADYPNALLALNRAIELKPAFAFSWLNRAKVFAALGRTEEARRDYQRVLSLDPNNGEARAALNAEPSVARPAAPGSTAPTALANASPAGSPVAATPAPAAAAPPPAQPAASNPGDRRVALVIGNSAYLSSARLPNAARDAGAIADRLRQVGFQQVIQENDVTRDKLDNALRRFSRIADGADWAVVYYAGHGLEMSGVNYLIPVDAKMESDRDVDFESVPVGRVMTSVEGARRLRLVILDACRNNPFLSQMRRTGADRSIGRGLARVEPDAGSLVVYAAKHGEVAMDGDAANSPFATALIKRIPTPGLEVRRLFDLIRDDVLASTNRRQQPFSYGSLSGSADFYFVSK